MCEECLETPAPLTAEYFCAACKTPFQNRYPLDEHGLCALCRNGLRGFDAAYCYGAYEGALRELIHLFKYGKMKPLADPLSGYLASALPRDQRFDVVAPMPMHWLRRMRRGFNQAELLAAATARRCGVPMIRAARRVRATRMQAGLSNSVRRQNVAGAFQVPRPELVKGRRVLLVDDVLTTGATASACGTALKRAGARSVSILTLARVDRRGAAPDGPAKAVSRAKSVGAL